MNDGQPDSSEGPRDAVSGEALAAYAGRSVSVCGSLSHYGQRTEPTTSPDDPTNDFYWRDVEVGDTLQPDDVYPDGPEWLKTGCASTICLHARVYRRRIEQPRVDPSDPNDPTGPGWAWVAKGDKVREGDMWSNGPREWYTTESIGQLVHYNNQYRRRIEPQPEQQPTRHSEVRPGVWRMRGGSLCLIYECPPVFGKRWTNGTMHWSDNRRYNLDNSVSDKDLVEYIGQAPEPFIEVALQSLAAAHKQADMWERVANLLSTALEEIKRARE